MQNNPAIWNPVFRVPQAAMVPAYDHRQVASQRFHPQSYLEMILSNANLDKLDHIMHSVNDEDRFFPNFDGDDEEFYDAQEEFPASSNDVSLGEQEPEDRWVPSRKLMQARQSKSKKPKSNEVAQWVEYLIYLMRNPSSAPASSPKPQTRKVPRKPASNIVPAYSPGQYESHAASPQPNDFIVASPAVVTGENIASPFPVPYDSPFPDTLPNRPNSNARSPPYSSSSSSSAEIGSAAVGAGQTGKSSSSGQSSESQQPKSGSRFDDPTTDVMGSASSYPGSAFPVSSFPSLNPPTGKPNWDASGPQYPTSPNSKTDVFGSQNPAISKPPKGIDSDDFGGSSWQSSPFPRTDSFSPPIPGDRSPSGINSKFPNIPVEPLPSPWPESSPNVLTFPPAGSVGVPPQPRISPEILISPDFISPQYSPSPGPSGQTDTKYSPSPNINSYSSSPEPSGPPDTYSPSPKIDPSPSPMISPSPQPALPSPSPFFMSPQPAIPSPSPFFISPQPNPKPSPKPSPKISPNSKTSSLRMRLNRYRANNN